MGDQWLPPRRIPRHTGERNADKKIIAVSQDHHDVHHQGDNY